MRVWLGPVQKLPELVLSYSSASLVFALDDFLVGNCLPQPDTKTLKQVFQVLFISTSDVGKCIIDHAQEAACLVVDGLNSHHMHPLLFIIVQRQ